jgi:isopenicillin-N epimerase
MPSAQESPWLLDPSVTFLNHGSYGACPRPVIEAQTRFRQMLEARPVEFMGRKLEDRLDQASYDLANFVGADADDVVFVPNATYGVNSVLRSLELQPGDELLVTDQEYNACRNVLNFVAQRSGAKVVVAEIPFPLTRPEIVLQRVMERVTERTKILLIDHITSPTGMVLPIEQIIAPLRELGVRVLVDGAHAPGMLDLKLTELGADYYTGNCHKWMNAPKSVAFLWVRPELQKEVRPACISHGANSERSDRSRYLLEFYWTGTADPTAALSVPAAIQFVEDLLPGGWPALRERNRKLALDARALLLQSLGMPAPVPDSMIGSLVSLPLPAYQNPDQLPPDGYDPLQVALRDQYQIEIPVMPWGFHSGPTRKRSIRMSVQAYNTIDDYQRLANALVELGAGAGVC